MRLLSSTFALFLSLVLVGAAVPHGHADLSARHNRLAQRASSLEQRAASPKKCKNRINKGASSSQVVATTAKAVTTKPAATTKPATTKPATTKPATTAKPATTKPAAASPVAAKPSNSKGLINVQSNCGPSGATRDITKLSGPNGNIDWLNCGFESAGGWQPPPVRIENVVTESLSSALQSPSSPFKACSKYIGLFEQYGNQYGIPPIMLASFAMQESSCNPNTVGGAGEQGLMQITRDKCGGAPGGDCKDPAFNIRTATKFFKDTIDSNGGNVLISVGLYNGWRRGLTKSQAFAAASSSCCRCQNNGDYLHQYFNGWCQNINAYDNKLRLGKYFNLDRCGN